MHIRLATRGSQLALWQANWVADQIRSRFPETTVELVVVRTTGDVKTDTPLSAMAGKGVFVREIEAALLRNEADIAAHSAKDLPSVDTPGLRLAAFCEREDPRDALISPHGGWGDLPEGITVATSAPRRIAQLKHARPDLNFVPIRGNVDTRLAKLERGDADALILAVAGLVRLGRGDVITERLPMTLSLPQVGQACVAVQCRAEDTAVTELVRAGCDHAPTRVAVTAERAFLSLLGGGCTVPVAAHAETDGEYLHLTARVATLDGSQMLEAAHRTSAAERSSEAVARVVYEELLERGANQLLSEQA